jgi:1-phosphofructokinase family hexose kinase
MIYTLTLNPTIDRTMVFPSLQVGQLNRASHSHTDLSGKGVNVSVALRRLGLDSVIMGFVAGIYGQLLLNGLERQGFVCDMLSVAGETRSNITVIDAAAGVTTKLNEPGPTVTEHDLAALEARLLARLQPADLLIMSGSLPPGAPDDTYARLMRAAHQVGTVVALDTSGAALEPGCRAGPDFCKPNDVEAQQLTGLALDDEVQLPAVLAAMLALGPKRILLSLGSRGAVYCDGQSAWRAVPPPIAEASAVGAGDASFTGCLWAWRQGLPGDQIARWAVATGTAAAQVAGSAMPTRAAIAETYGKVRVVAQWPLPLL